MEEEIFTGVKTAPWTVVEEPNTAVLQFHRRGQRTTGRLWREASDGGNTTLWMIAEVKLLFSNDGGQGKHSPKCVCVCVLA